MPKLKTSDFLLSKKEKLKEIISELADDFSYVSILGTDVIGKKYYVNSSSIGSLPADDNERGFVIRVFQDSGFSEFSFNDLNENIAAKVREIAFSDRQNFLKNKGKIEYKLHPSDEAAIDFFVGESENLIEEDSTSAIISHLQNLHDDARAKFKELTHLHLALNTVQVNKIFLSKNRDLYQSYAYSIATAYAVATKDDNCQSDFANLSGLGGSEILSDFKETVTKACQGARELLSAEKIEPGVYDIICDPDFSGLVAHEAFGHGAEMDMFVKNRAKAAFYINKDVASNKVNLHDGAMAAREVSSYRFDDEGNFGTDTLIIDRGILKTGICDAISSLLLNVKPTGNGKRESYKNKAYTRMTNTFFEGGQDKLEDMIASIKHGYLLEGCNSGMEDPKNWGIQCIATKGREIKDGKLTGKIFAPIYLTGYVPSLLDSISMLSSDIVLTGAGYCGKGWKEWVKTSTGGSYIKARGNLS